jgi:hypothetical protein
MDGGVEETFAAALGALAVTGVLFDVGDQAGIKNTLPIIPTVSLDVISLVAISYGYYRGQIEHRHWFRLMADPHEQFFWTLQQCSVMLLHRETSLSSGGEYDIDAKAMPLL